MSTLELIKYHSLVFLSALIVAGSFLVSEKLAGIISPVSLTLLRFSGASLILLPVVLSRQQWRSEVLSVLPRGMLVSLFYAVFFIGLFEALNVTTSLNAGTLFTLVPFITAVLSVIVLKESMSYVQVIIYVIGFTGTVWVIFGGQLELLMAFTFNTGDLIFLGAIFFMGFYTVSMKLFYRNDSMIVMVFCTLVGGSFWMGLVLLLSGQPLQWELLKAESYLHMLYLIVAATLMTVYLYQVTTVALGPGRVSAYIYLNPFLVAMLLFMVDGELIPSAVFPGILLSTLATVILQVRSSVSGRRVVKSAS